MAGFVSDLSGLPRIVTINDIHLVPEKEVKSEDGNGNVKRTAIARLSLNATIKTFRYLNEEESDEAGGN